MKKSTPKVRRSSIKGVVILSVILAVSLFVLRLMLERNQLRRLNAQAHAEISQLEESTSDIPALVRKERKQAANRTLLYTHRKGAYQAAHDLVSFLVSRCQVRSSCPKGQREDPAKLTQFVAKALANGREEELFQLFPLEGYGEGPFEASLRVQLICRILVLKRTQDLPMHERAAFAALVEIESGYNPSALSFADAAGLVQAKEIALRDVGQDWELCAFDAEGNLKAGLLIWEKNRRLVRKNKEPVLDPKLGQAVAFYQYHHDGPSQDFGGRQIAISRLVPIYLESLLAFRRWETRKEALSDLFDGLSA